MNEISYSPLTPAMRESVNSSIQKQLEELATCRNNAFVNAQMVGLKAAMNLINALPDGFPMPISNDRIYKGKPEV